MAARHRAAAHFLTSATSSNASSTPWRASTTRASSWIFRCSTIPPTRPNKSPAIASNATAPSACPSATFTATIARDTKPAPLQEGLKVAQGEYRCHFRRRLHSARATFSAARSYCSRDCRLAMVQTRWTYVNRGYSALTEVRGDSARRPLRHRAFGSLPQRRLFQL